MISNLYGYIKRLNEVVVRESSIEKDVASIGKINHARIEAGGSRERPGDGAVALLVGSEEGKPAFGPISHLTNDQPNDMNLLTMTSNSSHPFLKGRPQYFMQPNVPMRGAHYAVTTIKNVLEHPDSPVSDLTQVDDCLIHTGSKKILDGICSQLDLQTDSAKVHGSYKVLERYGNLSSASTGFMLAEKDEWSGPAMVVGFGVGFAASAGIMNFN